MSFKLASENPWFLVCRPTHRFSEGTVVRVAGSIVLSGGTYCDECSVCGSAGVVSMMRPLRKVRVLSWLSLGATALSETGGGLGAGAGTLSVVSLGGCSPVTRPERSPM